MNNPWDLPPSALVRQVVDARVIRLRVPGRPVSHPAVTSRLDNTGRDPAAEP
jgi:hypothetical protein